MLTPRGQLFPCITVTTDMSTLSSLTVRTYGPTRGSHSHDHFQILWNLEGCLELEIEGRGTRLAQGHGLLIAPSERHDFASRSGSRCLVLDTAQPVWAAHQRQPLWTPSADLLAQSLAQALHHGVPFSQDHAAALLAQLWGPTPVHTQAQRHIDWDALTQWASARLAAPLTVADLAAQAHLSESQFRVRFAQVHGCSPTAWLRQLRITKAAALRANGLSARDAAQQVGYESAAALATARRRALSR